MGKTRPTPHDRKPKLRLLDDSRRRDLLFYLVEHERADLDDFSKQLAAWEENSTVDAVPEGAHQRVALSLVHNHLPRLADHDIIEYDQQSGEIALVATPNGVKSHFEYFIEEDVGEDTGDDWSSIVPNQ